ncbi:MAG: Holliday junction resolvase RuvX [Catonella sp.]|nr:Holliday junction resolvase RuvX [Catonella sp.]MDY6356631.1 Holliday junction resolvase RuvX [Catonella sp.]
MRFLGLDLGSKTCGVAVSDPLNLTAQGVEVIRRKEENKYRRTLARIEELIAEYDITGIVLGYPKNMDDSVSKRCLISRDFAEKLTKRTGLPVTLWDERLTTVAAHEVMLEAGMSREEREKIVDKVAAVFILEDFLNDFNNRNKTEKEL